MAAVWTPLMALYNYDPSLLDNLHVPTVEELPANIEYIDPLPELSDEDLRLELLFELGELSPVYSDPEILKQMIAVWDRVNHKNWLQLWQTTLYKYNPIWNKDGSFTETRDLATSGTASSSDSRTTNTSNNATDQHSVTGYDTNTLSLESGDTHNDSGNITASGTSNGSESGSEKETITRKEQGNIGVTTTQAMIREQREIVEYNIYNFIIESFKKRFMIQVY